MFLADSVSPFPLVLYQHLSILPLALAEAAFEHQHLPHIPTVLLLFVLVTWTPLLIHLPLSLVQPGDFIPLLTTHLWIPQTSYLPASEYTHIYTYTPSWTRVDLRWLKKICIMQQEKKEKEHWPMRELQGSANTIISSKPDSL